MDLLDQLIADHPISPRSFWRIGLLVDVLTWLQVGARHSRMPTKTPRTMSAHDEEIL
jgi:hypothetical protein